VQGTHFSENLPHNWVGFLGFHSLFSYLPRTQKHHITKCWLICASSGTDFSCLRSRSLDLYMELGFLGTFLHIFDKWSWENGIGGTSFVTFLTGLALSRFSDDRCHPIPFFCACHSHLPPGFPTPFSTFSSLHLPLTHFILCLPFVFDLFDNHLLWCCLEVLPLTMGITWKTNKVRLTASLDPRVFPGFPPYCSPTAPSFPRFSFSHLLCTTALTCEMSSN